ncbi:hypothetical protein ACWGE0_39185 [Lentzea sp. NPDC054927]
MHNGSVRDASRSSPLPPSASFKAAAQRLGVDRVVIRGWPDPAAADPHEYIDLP